MAAVPRAGCRPLMAPGQANHPSFVAISRLPADKSVLGSESQATPDVSFLLASCVVSQTHVRVVASVHLTPPFWASVSSSAKWDA